MARIKNNLRNKIKSLILISYKTETEKRIRKISWNKQSNYLNNDVLFPSSLEQKLQHWGGELVSSWVASDEGWGEVWALEEVMSSAILSGFSENLIWLKSKILGTTFWWSVLLIFWMKSFWSKWFWHRHILCLIPFTGLLLAGIASIHCWRSPASVGNLKK